MPTNDILRDPVWQFWGVIATVGFGAVATILAIVVYKLQRNRKELTYDLVASTTLVKIDKSLGSRIQVLCDGVPVPDMSLIVLQIGNTGNQEIRAIDYERAISVTFPGSQRILSSEVSRTEPLSLAPTVSIDENSVSIEPCLLNSGDYMILSFLVAKYDNMIAVDGRIAGVAKIRSVTAKPRSPYVWLLATNFLSLVILGTLMILPVNAPNWLIVVYLLLLATFGIGNYFFMRDRSNQHRQ